MDFLSVLGDFVRRCFFCATFYVGVCVCGCVCMCMSGAAAYAVMQCRYVNYGCVRPPLHRCIRPEGLGVNYLLSVCLSGRGGKKPDGS